MRRFLYLIHVFAFHMLGETVKKEIEEDIKTYRIMQYHGEKMHKMFFLKEEDMFFIRLLNRHKEFRNLFYYRLDRIFFVKFLKLICPPSKLLFMTNKNNMRIEGGGILFQHPFSTILNAKSIGHCCIIRQNTTIGNTHENLDNTPIIGDNVNIGANVVIVGKIKIGNNVIIGAGTVVTKNVPDNCTIVGNPARIISRNGIRINEKL